jgi:hypothetical protein
MGNKGNKLTDLSGNNNYGRVYGATYTRLPSGAGSRNFDGLNDYILTKNAPSLNPTQGMTIEVLYKTNKQNALQSLVSKSWSSEIADGYTLWLTAQNDAQYIMYDKARKETYTSSIAPLAANSWYQVTGIYDGHNITVYVNGVKYGTAKCEGTSPSSLDLTIGRYSPNALGYLKGSIATVRIYNRALSDVEIKNNYNADKWRTK